MKLRLLIPIAITVILIILIAALAIIYLPISEQEGILIKNADTLSNPPLILKEYGLPVDSFIIITGKIKKNQMLSELLYDYGISNQKVNEFILASEGITTIRGVMNRLKEIKRLNNIPQWAESYKILDYSKSSFTKMPEYLAGGSVDDI